MSKTNCVSYDARSFWAYDVALSVLLKHMIDAAGEFETSADANWLAKQIEYWRAVAGIGSGIYGLDIKSSWPSNQIDCFIAVVQSACLALSRRTSIPEDEIVSWPIFEDLSIHTRGATEVKTAPVIELGNAIVALVDGSLPPAPLDTWWYFGLPNGLSTVEMRVSEWHGDEA